MFIINLLSLFFVIIGAMNLGVTGAFNYNVLSAVLGGEIHGTYNLLTRAVFIIIGLAGIWMITFLGKPGVLRGKACKCKKE